MTDQGDFPHLNNAAKAVIHKTDKERIHFIRTGTWLNYKRAKEIRDRLEELLEYPRITRMPNMLLVAPSFPFLISCLAYAAASPSRRNVRSRPSVRFNRVLIVFGAGSP